MASTTSWALLAAVAVACALVIGSANAHPQQIHLGRADVDGHAVFVSWLSADAHADAFVAYGTQPDALSLNGKQTQAPLQYTYKSQYNDTKYTSPFIYHFVLAALAPSTRYYYQCGAASGSSSAVLSFTTAPAVGASTPLVVGVMGDLGQTADSVVTAQHLMSDETIQLSLLIGDLSYADAGNKPSKERPCSQDRWDSWGNIIEPLMSTQTVVPLPGNHEVEKSGLAEHPDFIAYQSRFRTPSDASGGETNLYFAFRSASAHFIALSSYSDFGAGSRQYQWLQNTLAQVDRTATPWLIVSFHAPWYSSNVAHQGEFPSIGMRAAMEPLLLQYGVDLVFSGHVHAYERTAPVALNQTDAQKGITYIGIGDGGNREGPADQWLPAPAWSAYREAKFGHGRLQIFNQTHAHWTWQKNEDALPVAGDQTWLVRTQHSQRLVRRFGGGLVAIAGAA